MTGSWRQVPLGTLCAIESGKSNTQDAVDDGPYTFFDRSKTAKKSSRYLYDCEALIIPGEGTEFLPRHFVGKFDLHQRAYALSDFSSEINVRFLFHYLTYFKEWFVREAVGATVKSLRRRHFTELPVVLPPLWEQRRIVAILSEALAGIDAVVANAEKNLSNARELFESYLNSVFSHGNGWPEQQLNAVCHKITVGHVGAMMGEYCEEGIPFLRSKNVRPFDITLEDVVYIDEAFNASLQKSALSPGDLVIVRTGYPGTAAVIPDDLARANCSDLVIFRPGKQVDAHYLEMFFNSAYGKRMVGGKLTGAAQKHFNVTAAKEVSIPIPPLPEQNRLVAELHHFRKRSSSLEEHYIAKAVMLTKLKQSILQKAFAGELTAKEAERELAAA